MFDKRKGFILLSAANDISFFKFFLQKTETFMYRQLFATLPSNDFYC